MMFLSKFLRKRKTKKLYLATAYLHLKWLLNNFNLCNNISANSFDLPSLGKLISDHSASYVVEVSTNRCFFKLDGSWHLILNNLSAKGLSSELSRHKQWLYNFQFRFGYERELPLLAQVYQKRIEELEISGVAVC